MLVDWILRVGGLSPPEFAFNNDSGWWMVVISSAGNMVVGDGCSWMVARRRRVAGDGNICVLPMYQTWCQILLMFGILNSHSTLMGRFLLQLQE